MTVIKVIRNTWKTSCMPRKKRQKIKVNEMFVLPAISSKSYWYGKDNLY